MMTVPDIFPGEKDEKLVPLTDFVLFFDFVL